MRHKLQIPIVSAHVLLLTTAFQCGKEPEPDPTHVFQEPVRLFPAQKRYRVGDTIWVAYQSPGRALVDRRTGQPVALDSVALPFAFGYNSRHGAPVSPAGGFCDFVAPTGGGLAVNPGPFGAGALLDFGCGGAGYGFRVGVVPKLRGVYSLDLSPVPRPISACPGRRTRFPLSVIEYRFAVADGNKDVYLAIPANQRVESPNGYTERQIDNKAVFVFQTE